MHLIHRKTCRVCGSAALTKVIDLGEQYLQGSFVKPGKEIPRPAPRCRLAGPLRPDARRERLRPAADGAHGAAGDALLRLLVPLGHEPRRCATTSRASRARRPAIGDRARAPRAGHRMQRRHAARAYPADSRKIRRRPVGRRAGIGDGVKVVQDIFPSPSSTVAAGESFDIVTSIAMFYDLEDPVAFARGDQEHAWRPTASGCFEMSYMPTMLEMNSLRHHLPRAPRVLQPGGHRVHPREARACGSSRALNAHQRRQHPLLRHPRRQLPIPPAEELPAQRPHAAPGRVRSGARHRQAVPRISRSASTSTATSSAASSEEAEAGGQADSHLRRLDQGQHHPAVVRDRQLD